MSKRCYYEVLGVARTCSEAELKTSFRKLAMQHHPDRNSGDKDAEHKFKEINEAYDVLKDPQKKAAYDRFGHVPAQYPGAHGAGTEPQARRENQTATYRAGIRAGEACWRSSIAGASTA